ncbi:MAG: (Na+)-NQR maturation NqrM [Gammaproteobacteria bacterium]
MTTILLAIVFFLVLFAAMAIGIMLGRPPIKGSCGGMAALTAGTCEICGGDPARCESGVAGKADAADGAGKVERFDPRDQR